MSNELEKRVWTPNSRLSVDYYVDPELSKRFEYLNPHDRFSQRMPADFMKRGVLLPFAVLCTSKEYGGLDEAGYIKLAKAISGPVFLGSWEGALTLSAPETVIDENTKSGLVEALRSVSAGVSRSAVQTLSKIHNSALLTQMHYEGRVVLMPTESYVIMNK
jgi:hypothetical protein